LVNRLSVCDKPLKARVPNIALVEFARTTRDMSLLESQLRAEIDFWEEMIDSQKTRVSAAALERMRLALALAERKLTTLAATSFAMDGERGSRAGSRSGLAAGAAKRKH
jgi:hypothetical protein